MSTIISTNQDSFNPRRRRKKQRDLLSAVTLRPAEVRDLYGIPTSTLCQMCNHPDHEKRIPSMLTPGRRGRKGLRLIYRHELEAWLARWRTVYATVDGSIDPKAA